MLCPVPAGSYQARQLGLYLVQPTQPPHTFGDIFLYVYSPGKPRLTSRIQSGVAQLIHNVKVPSHPMLTFYVILKT